MKKNTNQLSPNTVRSFEFTAGSALTHSFEFRDVSGGYGKKTVVQQISLNVRLGEILLLIGPNGSGKSTLLKIAIGLLNPSTGALRLNGSDITGLDTHERVRNGLSYVMQGGQVFPSLSVRENLEMGLLMSPRSDKVARLETVLELLPTLQEHMARRAGLLSGGQRQILALGMVLSHRPQVLLLDEPTAGLSPLLAAEFMNTLRALTETLNVSMILVEQRVREALLISHRAVAMSGGRIMAETENTAEWLSEGELDRYYFEQ